MSVAMSIAGPPIAIAAAAAAGASTGLSTTTGGGGGGGTDDWVECVNHCRTRGHHVTRVRRDQMAEHLHVCRLHVRGGFCMLQALRAQSLSLYATADSLCLYDLPCR
jgi:hypothetical protein